LEDLAGFYLRGLFCVCISTQESAAMVMLAQFSAAVFNWTAKDKRADICR